MMRGGWSRSGLAPGRGASGGSKTARSPQALRREGGGGPKRGEEKQCKVRHYPACITVVFGITILSREVF